MLWFINFEILRDNPDLFQYLKEVIHRESDEELTGDRLIEKAVRMLQGHKEINYNMLLLEQLKYFYKLQPGEVSVGD